MSLVSYGWKSYAPRWWALTFPRLPKYSAAILEELSEVPGVQHVRVRKDDASSFYDVEIALHESAFTCEPLLQLWDAYELAGKPRGDATPVPVCESLRALRPYQRDGVEWLLANHGGVLGDEMGLGKGLPNDAPVLTPRGYVAIGALRLNDEVCTTYGATAHVLGVYPQGERDVYRVTLTDGSSVLADDQHLWSVNTAAGKHRGTAYKTLATTDLLRLGVKCAPNARGDRHNKWFLPDVSPVYFAAQPVSVDPYLLGVLLGDASFAGTVVLHNSHPGVRAAVCARYAQAKVRDDKTIALNGLYSRIRGLGLAGARAWEKRIPAEYLLNTVSVRREVLAGLLDTDAECRKDGTVVYTTTSPRLADDVAFLVRGLGGAVSITQRVPTFTYNGEKRCGRVAYVLNIRTRVNPFLERTERAERWRPSRCTRAIAEIEYVGRMATTCISVSSQDKLFLTDNVTPTHNTTTAIVAAYSMQQAWDAKAPVLVVGPKFTCDVWRRELRAVLGDVAYFACSGRKPTPEQEQELAKANWVFIHYEILDGWRPALTRPLFGRKPVVSIFDEAHWLKNPRSKRGKSALAIGPLTAGRIVLSGTPIANKVLDLWPLLTLAGGIGSFGTSFQFADRYTIHEKGAYGWASFGTRRMPELHSRLERFYLRRTIEDVGTEIPRMTREQLVVPGMTTVPKELRKWAGNNLELALDRFRDAFRNSYLGADTLEALMTWRKATSEYKIPTTSELAASLLGEGESVVVFCWQRETAETIARAVKESLDEGAAARVQVVHGGYAQEVRDEIVRNFQACEDPCCIVATIDSLKEGVTLHRARRTVVHDLHWVPATMLQAEARINRLGQTRPTLSTWVIAANSVDEIIAEHLLSKALTIEEALGDSRAVDAFTEAGLQKEDVSMNRFVDQLLDD